MPDWTAVHDRVQDAKAIAWDECHKIYVLMDDRQVHLMRGYGYEPYLITLDEMNPEQMYVQLKEWYEGSCSLRFIEAVTTTTDPNEGFDALIPQGADWDEEEDD